MGRSFHRPRMGQSAEKERTWPMVVLTMHSSLHSASLFRYAGAHMWGLGGMRWTYRYRASSP